MATDKMGKSSFRILYSIEVDGKIVSEGYTHHVCMNLTSKKPERLPEKLIEKLNSFQIQESD